MSCTFALKVATTLDRFVATKSGDSKWITGEAARQEVAFLREQYDAIAVSWKTVQRDDPTLTIRIPDREVFCRRRLVLDAQGHLLDQWQRYKIFTDSFASQTVLILGEDVKEESLLRAQDKGLVYWQVENSPEGRISLHSLRARCSKENLSSVFWEAGGSLGQSLLADNLVDHLYLFIAPKILGNAQSIPAWQLNKLPFLRFVQQKVISEDILVELQR